MIYYLIKLFITAGLIVAISELSRKSTFAGALLASVPLVSVLAMLWLYIDTRDLVKISAFSMSVFWLVVPSLALFVSLPVLLKLGINFYLSMGVAIGLTVGCYLLTLGTLGYFGVRL
jgi:hypothetical protein